MGGVRHHNGRNVIERWNDVFAALSAEPRRQLIFALLDRAEGDGAPLPESAVNPNVPVDPDRLRIELRHTHLPMLEDLGYVEWDADPLVAYRGPDFEAVGVVVDSLHVNASSLPDSLVVGCQRLEAERELDSSRS